MTIDELRRKFPIRNGKDHGNGVTIGQLSAMIDKALSADASRESRRAIASDIIDREFLFGAWGDRWKEHDCPMLADIRGLIMGAWEAGRAGR